MASETAVKTKSEAALRPLPHFQGARDSGSAQRCLREIQRRARTLREEMLAGPQVVYYRSFPLVRVPYPVEYGFWRAAKVRTPLLHILNRLFVVQFKTARGDVKTLLFSPSDVEGNKETPFFKRLKDKARLLGKVGERLLAPVYNSVEGCLERVGLRPEDVDYISYDHLHTQELRRWLGGHAGQPAVFPNAKLLVMKDEWESVFGLLPFQAQWYCPGGCDGIDPEKLILLETDTALGEGVALVRTPGHTPGNHSLVAHTPAGLLVSSENGISADSYAPLSSRISGVASYARSTGVEVILNGNVLDTGTIEQYLSMMKEREIAGPASENPAFYNVVPSSEFSAYWAFPGIKPTFSFGELEFGAPHLPARG